MEPRGTAPRRGSWALWRSPLVALMKQQGGSGAVPSCESLGQQWEFRGAECGDPCRVPAAEDPERPPGRRRHPRSQPRPARSDPWRRRAGSLGAAQAQSSGEAARAGREWSGVALGKGHRATSATPCHVSYWEPLLALCRPPLASTGAREGAGDEAVPGAPGGDVALSRWVC